MKTILGMILSAVGGLLLCGAALAAEPAPMPKPFRPSGTTSIQTMDQGNYKDAYDGLRKIILEPGQPIGDDLRSGGAMPGAPESHRRGRRVARIGRQGPAGRPPGNGWFLVDIARTYSTSPKQGTIIAGKFYRGPHRGAAGDSSTRQARDRVRALQLMVQAMPDARKDDDHRQGGRLPAGPWPTCC